MKRVKTVAAQRKTTFRALVVDALERSLEEKTHPFELQDASVGLSPESGKTISNETINQAIDSQRDPHFNP